MRGRIKGEKIRKSLGYMTWERAQKKARDLDTGADVLDESLAPEDALRRALGNLSRERALRDVREWEGPPKEAPKKEPITVEAALRQFLADLEGQHLHPSTMRKFKAMQRKLEAFAKQEGIALLENFDLDKVRQFRAAWKSGPRTAAKNLERLRSFFRFAQEGEWIAKNPAKTLKAPKVTPCPTLPYTREEVIKILAAVPEYMDVMPEHGRENARRMRAMVLLLSYSGLRIGDVVRLTSERITGGNKLFLYTQKGGTAVNVVLPEFVVAALNATPKTRGNYFFWSGAGDAESGVRSWQTRLQKLIDLAGVPDGHAHRFRDTFAVELLLAGVPLERVSILLGHSSLKITEKHYNPWVRSRQEQLEADQERALALDPVAHFEAAGTRQVHGSTQISKRLQ